MARFRWWWYGPGMTTRDDIAGTWMHPTGTRIDVRYDDGRWRAYSYMTRHGTRPSAVHEFDDVAQLRAAVSRLEQQGYIRQVDGQPEPPRPADQNAGIALLVLGAICVLVIVLALTV